MKQSIKFWHILFFVLIGKISYSQNTLYGFVNSSIASTKLHAKLPTILIGPERYVAINTVDLKNYPNSIVQESYYYFYKVGNDIYVTKFVEVVTCRSCPKIKFHKSKPIVIANDTLFKWVLKNDSAINSEYIRPYIYLDTVREMARYNLGFLPHSFPFSMTIYHNGKFQNFSFDDIAMQEYLIEGDSNFPPNLNYQYNSSTLIFRLYKILTSILYSSSEKFDFRE